MKSKFQKEVEQLQKMQENLASINLTETIDGVEVTWENFSKDEVLLLLEENDFEYEDLGEIIIVADSVHELYEEFEEYDFGTVKYFISSDENSSAAYTLQDLQEANAKRKVVVRKGKRKIIFQCPHGQKKVKRRCVRIPTKDLMKMKRRAKRSARKSRGKRARANRRRKMSMRRRPKTRAHKSPKK